MLDHKLYSAKYFTDIFHMATFFTHQSPKLDAMEPSSRLDRVFRITVINVLNMTIDAEIKLVYLENAKEAYEIVKEQYEISLQNRNNEKNDHKLD